MTDQMNPAMILDLSAPQDEQERPAVMLPNGQQYHVRLPDDVPLRDQLTIQRTARALARLTDPEGKGAEEVTDAEAAAVMQRIDRMLLLILPDAPPEVVQGLSDNGKQRLFDWYLSFVAGGQSAAQ